MTRMGIALSVVVLLAPVTLSAQARGHQAAEIGRPFDCLTFEWVTEERRERTCGANHVWRLVNGCNAPVTVFWRDNSFGRLIDRVLDPDDPDDLWSYATTVRHGESDDSTVTCPEPDGPHVWWCAEWTTQGLIERSGFSCPRRMSEAGERVNRQR